MKPHTLSILVENRAGVLSRVTGLFSRRGFNIESLAVGPCEEPDMSRITIVVIGDDEKIEQVMKQLNKLIDVIKRLAINFLGQGQSSAAGFRQADDFLQPGGAGSLDMQADIEIGYHAANGRINRKLIAARMNA